MTDYTPFDYQPAEWMRHAACRHHNTNLWFPERGDPTDQAKNICSTCPVRNDCLNYAIAIPNLVGIWGGLSTRERRKHRQTRLFIRHGTPTGYNQHRRQGEPACPACRQAHTEAVQQRKHRKP